MPPLGPGSVPDQLRKAAEAQARVQEAARQAGDKAPQAPAQPAQPKGGR